MLQSEADKSAPMKVRKSNAGRPPALKETDELLKQIEGLARIQCTQAEAAAVLGVHRQTFSEFLDAHEKARAAWDNGRETGKASLRRNQFKMAESNTAMSIWLGKQYLDQKDKSEAALTGADGGPLQSVAKIEVVVVSAEKTIPPSVAKPRSETH